MRKWLVPLCVFFVLLLVFLVLLLPHGDLYAYALSLKDPSLFVCGDGSLWRLASEYPNGELLLTPEGKSVPNTVKRGTTTEDSALQPWEYAFRTFKEDAFFASDGSLWRRRVTRAGGQVTVLPIMEREAPAEETGREAVKLGITANNPWLSSSFRSIFVAAHFLTEPPQPEPIARLAVELSGCWYAITPSGQTGRIEPRQRNSDKTVYTYELYFGEPGELLSGWLPAGHYRAELLSGGQLLRFSEFTLSKDDRFDGMLHLNIPLAP